MALDFPASPTNGQKYPVTPVAGIPQYTYDGEKWTTPSGSIGSTGEVRYDTQQALTATQQQQARVNVYAAPFDAMSCNGMQVNGSMEVMQFSAANMPLDCWRSSISAAGSVVTTTQGANVLTFPGFQNYVYAYVTTAKPSLAAAEFAVIYSPIEGYRVSRLAYGTANARPITIGFWTAHHRTGIYTIAVINGATNRSYVTTYNQVASDTSEYHTVTIPGDTTGTWDKANGIGLYIYLTFAMGTTYSAPTLNTWNAGYYFGHTSQVNAIAATSDVTVFSGIVVLPGNEAPTAAQSPYVMRPWTEELLLCKRYWQQIGMIVETGSIAFGTVTYSVPMRVAPTATGGGVGFAMSNPSTVSSAFYQTTRGTQTITLDARL